jgi:hypothetical protein
LVSRREDDPTDAIARLLISANEDDTLRRRVLFLLQAPIAHRQSLINTALAEMKLRGDPLNCFEWGDGLGHRIIESARMSPIPSDPLEQEEEMICPSCLGLNPPEARYCAHCHAPLSSTVMLDPIGQIQAQGFAFRQATAGKPNLIIVVGIWLLFFPVVISAGIVIVLAFTGLFSWSGNVLLEFAAPTLIAAASVVLLYKTTMNYRRKRRESKAGETDQSPPSPPPTQPAAAASEKKP